MADRWRDEDRWGRDHAGRDDGRPVYGRERYGADYQGRAGRYDYGYGRTGTGDYERVAGYGARDFRRDDLYGRQDHPQRDTGYYGRQDWGRDRDYRDYRGYRGEERDWMDRAGDEVASWFGDEEAERRRRMDEWRDDRDYERRRRYGRGEGVAGRFRDDW